MKLLRGRWFSMLSAYIAAAFVILSYWLLTQLTRQYIAIDEIISLVTPAAGIGIVALLYGGIHFAPAVFIGSILGYSSYGLIFEFSYSLSPNSIIALSIINALQSIVGAYFLKRVRDLSSGINTVSDFAFLWLAGYITALFGAALSGAVLAFDKNTELTHGLIKTLIFWWQGNALGIVLTTTALLIWINIKDMKGWIYPRYRPFEAALLFGAVFLSGQVIFLDWYTESLGALGRGYWIYLFISLAAIRFGKQGAVLVLVIVSIQALYGSVQGTGFFRNDIENTNLTNLWVYIQVVAFVGMLQAIIIADKKRQATYDDLTSLPNRRLFLTRLRSEMSRASRNNQALGLIFIDLDRFKEVNDSLGHHVGDELLVLVSERLQSCVRSSDIVARLGGDEFTVIIPDINDIAHTDSVVAKIINSVREPFHLADQNISISASAGITLYPNDANTIEDLMKFADQAMYSAKSSGKNCFQYFSAEMQVKMLLKSKLMLELEDALHSGDISMYYQPVMDLSTKKIVKAEALIRWNHPELGFINPEDFIAFAEETGRITMLGEWIILCVLHQLSEWRELHHTDIAIAINMSPLQFISPENNKKIIDTANGLGIPAEKVVLEITEGLLLEERDEILNEFKRFDEAGIKLAIDDFGTGYSSLAYVKKFPIQIIKVDKSFINEVSTNEDSKELVKAIIAMATALNVKVVAEGVETEGHHEFLSELGCDFGQGYFYSKPLPADEFSIFINDSPVLLEGAKSHSATNISQQQAAMPEKTLA